MTWHSMACVLAVALFTFGQGTFAAKREVNADEVAFLRQQPEEITLKYSGLDQQLANADSARLDAELAASVSEEARVELAAKHVDVELDLTIDYKPTSGPVRGIWLRLRGSLLRDIGGGNNSYQVRAIFSYDIPVL